MLAQAAWPATLHCDRRELDVDDLQTRFHQLDEATRRVARAVGELQLACESPAPLESRVRSLLEAIVEQLQALQVELANETERAWNRAEAAVRQAQRARLMDQIHDATTPDAPIVEPIDSQVWRALGSPTDME
jgi:hypothetical protein